MHKIIYLYHWCLICSNFKQRLHNLNNYLLIIIYFRNNYCSSFLLVYIWLQSTVLNQLCQWDGPGLISLRDPPAHVPLSQPPKYFVYTMHNELVRRKSSPQWKQHTPGHYLCTSSVSWEITFLIFLGTWPIVLPGDEVKNSVRWTSLLLPRVLGWCGIGRF